MSRHGKLLARLLEQRNALTWQELATLLQGFGYLQLPGRGSRVKFDNGDPAAMISLHKPHPCNEVKAYARRHVIEHLRAGGLIP
ncbi:type II toxin-antitoxin system HicA family toxin [Stutzerimonas kirkiae]|uniref:type II toxin-antitoxin system HicA family toxin n=1 Tax=Stutzerimonas kirkiae TaxID=2211392 RepID=UPI00103851D8|nr:type II toxin-antitoxin system HicA family toxin [Stutzerimonas kirkiae]TBV14684.1 type II toxin-antitoxin system HicA family toxin [Stutzerimonas kirkiae]